MRMCYSSKDNRLSLLGFQITYAQTTVHLEHHQHHLIVSVIDTQGSHAPVMTQGGTLSCCLPEVIPRMPHDLGLPASGVQVAQVHRETW